VILAAVSARSPIVRAGLEALLRSSATIEVVDDLSIAHVLLVDGEIEADGAPVVQLTDDAASALRSGARGLLPADASEAEVIGAVEAVAAGLVAIHPRFMDVLAPATRAVAELAEPLTPRELEVLRLLAEGVGNKEIAWRLTISEHTVKFHVASVLDKLHASSRTEAVAKGIRAGIVMV